MLIGATVSSADRVLYSCSAEGSHRRCVWYHSSVRIINGAHCRHWHKVATQHDFRNEEIRGEGKRPPVRPHKKTLPDSGKQTGLFQLHTAPKPQQLDDTVALIIIILDNTLVFYCSFIRPGLRSEPGRTSPSAASPSWPAARCTNWIRQQPLLWFTWRK